MMLAGPAACRSGQRVLAALRRPLSASAGCASTSCTATRTTLNWVDNWVVGQKLCPFAKPLRSADALRIAITHATTEDGVCASFADELVRKSPPPPIPTPHPRTHTQVRPYAPSLNLPTSHCPSSPHG